ncbi:MAG TPA: RHS repeat-associated core domain-containing protein, partial [Ktedonobacterales bacterium]|nr:RHS repeat-associated core domain-containing protein [Ktedonobacterales bacterium]
MRQPFVSSLYDERGAPVSVQVGSSSTSPRYYYVYDARGDVVNLTDASGAVVATYAYDAWGNLTTSSENIPGANGWVNPFRFDGRDGVRYDDSDGLYWMCVRAYDPTIGRFLSRDPLSRAPLFFADNPYVYAGNNPLSNVDPSGQYRASGHGAQTQVESWTQTKRHVARIVQQSGCDAACQAQIHAEWVRYHVGLAKHIANAAVAYFKSQADVTPGLGIVPLGAFKGAGILEGIQKWLDRVVFGGLTIATYAY